MERIQSFKSFSDVKKQLREEAILKETSAKRDTSAAAFSELLKKYNVGSIAEITEDQMQDFMSELVGDFKFKKTNESAEVLEAMGRDLRSDVAAKLVQNYGDKAWGERASYGDQQGYSILRALGKQMAKAAGVNKSPGDFDYPYSIYFDGGDLVLGDKTVGKTNGKTLAQVAQMYTALVSKALTAMGKKNKSNESVEVVEEGNKNREMVASAWTKTGVKDLNSIAKLYADAMEDANFHQEMETSKAIGSASRGRIAGLKGSDIASAAGWDGYAIANGTVDFLKGIGEDKAAEKLYAAISKFDLNESVNLNSLEQIIEEGTRGQFGKIYKSGEIASVYTHYDSYPEHMLPTIKKGYKKGTDVDAVLGKGDNSGLEVSPDKMKFYGDPRSLKPTMGNVKNLKKYISDADGQGAEYIYLFDERDQKWYMVDVYGDRELVPAFESVVTEAEVMIFNEIGAEIESLYSKLNDLAEETTDSAWRKAIENIIKGIEGIEKNIGRFDSKLGVIPTHEDLQVIEAEDAFAGWIAFYNGKKLEIKKEEANGIWAAKQLAIKKLNVPKSKQGLLAIAPAVEEAVIAEAEINNEEEFRAYAEEVLKKAHGEDYDEAKAKEAIDGILAKADGDFGAAVGMLTSGLGEAVEANEDMVPGGLADGMTAEDLAKKHGVEVAEIEAAIEKGIKVEMEHTDDNKIAKEVAMDHIFEDPKYYDKLADMENESEEVAESAKEEQKAMEIYVSLVDKAGPFSEDQMTDMSLDEIEDYLKDNMDLKGSELKNIAKEVHKIATSK